MAGGSGAIAADVTVMATVTFAIPLRGCGFAAGGYSAERLGDAYGSYQPDAPARVRRPIGSRPARLARC